MAATPKRKENELKLRSMSGKADDTFDEQVVQIVQGCGIWLAVFVIGFVSVAAIIMAL